MRCRYRDVVRIATWNVNSVKQRVPRLLPWLDERRPDVVCLQETKLADEPFAELLGDELAERGYEVAAHGEAAWNGVAILSRVGLDDVVARTRRRARASRIRRRARCRRRAAGSASSRCTSRTGARRTPSTTATSWRGWRRCGRWSPPGPEATVVCGDMNIAPTDEDVFDPDAYVGQTHVTPPERAALAELQALGLHDVVRDRWPTERVFTYWDYRAGMFHQDLGMRIDLVLAGAAGRRPRAGGLGRPPGPQGQGTERSRAGDRRPRRGAGRRHRAGRAAAVRAGGRGAARSKLPQAP